MVILYGVYMKILPILCAGLIVSGCSYSSNGSSPSVFHSGRALQNVSINTPGAEGSNCLVSIGKKKYVCHIYVLWWYFST